MPLNPSPNSHSSSNPPRSAPTPSRNTPSSPSSNPSSNPSSSPSSRNGQSNNRQGSPRRRYIVVNPRASSTSSTRYPYAHNSQQSSSAVGSGTPAAVVNTQSSTAVVPTPVVNTQSSTVVVSATCSQPAISFVSGAVSGTMSECTNLSGSDMFGVQGLSLINAQTPSAESCYNFCAQHPGCESFVFAPKTNVCYPKNANENTVSLNTDPRFAYFNMTG